jgi:hypothetical protein
MTVRIDPEGLGEWARFLDRLPPLSDQPHPVTAAPSTPVRQANLDALRVLADVMATVDAQIERLRAVALVAADSYSLVDEGVASIVESHVP